MKCKTCRHWTSIGHKLGRCSGIFSSSMVIPIQNQPKGKPDGKLVVNPGIITNSTYVSTPENWFCKNWSVK